MIVDKFVPQVYYHESRDFAYAARLYQLIFNYMKTAADCVDDNTTNENVNAFLVDLLVDTLGFQAKHQYNTRDLIYLASAFSELIKYKGTATAIDMAVRLLINSQHITYNIENNYFNISQLDPWDIEIIIPEELTDIILLEDLFDYILPAGFTYHFKKVASSSQKTTTSYEVDDTNDPISGIHPVTITEVADNSLGAVRNGYETIGSGIDPNYHIGTIYTGLTPLSNPQTETE